MPVLAIMLIAEGANKFTVLAQVLPTGLWVALSTAAIFYFRSEIQRILIQMESRLRHGATVKIGSVELGAVYVSKESTPRDDMFGISIKKDDGQREDERKALIETSRSLNIVHKLSPSSRANQRFDALLYILPHGDHTLLGVAQVSYYLGLWWDGKIFTTSDRSNSFAILTSTRAPFLCTARITFTDGTATTISRYVDFEMRLDVNVIA